MPMVRVSNGGTLQYKEIALSNVGANSSITVDLSDYDFVEVLVASGVFANSYSSAVAYTSGVISLDGGDTESFYFRSNSSISVRLIESHKIKVTWTYSYPLTNVHALILYK